MKRALTLFVVLVLSGLSLGASCGRGNPPPGRECNSSTDCGCWTLVTEGNATRWRVRDCPEPQTQGPLVAVNGKWQRDGKPWTMRMVVVCCKGSPDSDPSDLAKDHKWPLTDIDFVNWISFHKQNTTEIRPFMCPQHEGGDFYSPYKIATPDKKVNLDEWNPAFWDYIDTLLTEGDKKGAIFMVGVIDTWPQDHGLSPWCGSCNVNGLNQCDSGVLRGPITARGLAFARKVFEETGKHKNVIYQDGNESFEAMSGDWTLGMQTLLRQVEAEKGFVRHPYGTQQRDSSLRAQVDFVTAEQDTAMPIWCGPTGCKPTIVNETSPLTPKAVLRNVYAAEAKGASFAFWMGEQNEGERGQTLIALEGWSDGKPNPFPMAESCPLVAGIDAKVHQHVCNNQTVSEPCVGGSTVVDSTPNFGRRGPRGVCNSEHDNCDGRVCEPPDGLTWEVEAPPGVRCVVQNEGECGGQCNSVPCKAGFGYQLKCENQRSGHYRAQPFIRNGVDCEGKGLRPGVTAGDVVEWDVP